MFLCLLQGFDEAEAEFGDGVIEAALFVGSEVAFRFLLEHGEEIDVVAAEVEIGLPAFAEGEEAHVELGLEAKRVDEEVEIRRRELGASAVVFDVGFGQENVVFRIQHDFSLLRSLRRCRHEWRHGTHECVRHNQNVGNVGEKLQQLVDIMARLRAPDGCPWDREQNFDTIKKYTVEETYEVLDAIDRRDWADLREELGDYILQAVFYAQMASEEGHFDFGDCLDAINEKLIRRHPHIFGDLKAETGDEVLKLWDAVKATEKKKDQPQGMLDGIPRAQPALLEAQQISSRAARAGFDWSGSEDVIAKLEEEIAEYRAAIASGSRDEMEDEMGDLLFTIVNLARFGKVDPEQALRRTNAKFRKRFTHVEQRLREDGREVTGTPIGELEALWQEAKK